MLQTIKLKFVNEKLHIGMVNWREVYILHPEVIQLNPEVDRGRLVYRFKGSTKRFRYSHIKKALIEKTYIINIDYPAWYFK